MKKVTDELSKYQNNNIAKELKKSFNEALEDEMFANLVEQLKLPKKQLYSYTSLLEECAEEHKSCQACRNILTCENKITGHTYTPVVLDGVLEFAYQACQYQKELKKNNAYLMNVDYFHQPKSLQEARMKDIYKDDKNRYETLKSLNDFIKKYPKVEKGIYLHGSFGSGKTYLIAAMFNELAKKNVKGAIVYWPEFLRNLKGSFNTDFNEKIQYIQKIPLLLIDDIGAESVTEWGRDEILGSILQYRMQNNMPTFFTSNFDLAALEEHFRYSKDKVSAVKARRIIERINFLAQEQKLVGKNIRS